MWNTNGSFVDLFLKTSSIDGASRLLDEAKIKYSIVIDDLQRAIETENPSTEVIQQLQNRKGKHHQFYFLIMYLFFSNRAHNDAMIIHKTYTARLQTKHLLNHNNA